MRTRCVSCRIRLARAPSVRPRMGAAVIALAMLRGAYHAYQTRVRRARGAQRQPPLNIARAVLLRRAAALQVDAGRPAVRPASPGG
jgi:hypothetical protein